jgi:hypothetical protein
MVSKPLCGVVGVSFGFPDGYVLDEVMVIDIGRDAQFSLVRPPQSASTPAIE